jgi:FAD/FMN-containing dehydrogenase
MPTSAVSIQDLRAGLKGRVIAPGDPDYDEARSVFVGGIDRRPALIARPTDASDVARVVTAARETGAELAVRSGGHSSLGHSVSEGGVVLDLHDMRAIEIDAEARTAWAETGLTAAEYTVAAGSHGLATGFGDTGSVGIGGITLGGGVGFLVRKYGLTIDDLLAAEVVTADGEILQVDEESHPDLFWAIRGGGGNFGVATRFKFRLNEVPAAVGGMLLLPATPETIAGFIAESEAAPEELSTIANVMPAPPMPFVPPEHHGKMVVMGLMCFAGDAEAGERAIAPFRALAEPLADMVKPISYPEMYPPEMEDYHPMAATRTMFMNTVDESVGKTILGYLEDSDAFMRVTQIRALGGAMARVPAEGTAFAHRSSRLMTNVAAVFMHPEAREKYEAWVGDFAAALRQDDAGVYVNFLAGEGLDGVRAAYPGATWDRLTATKRQYDPDNFFRLNQNIPPA